MLQQGAGISILERKILINEIAKMKEIYWEDMRLKRF